MDLWGDESGEPTFTNMRRPYFIVGTMACHDPNLAGELLNLRVKLARQGYDLPHGFHTIMEPPDVREKVFNVLSQRHVRVVATVVDKRNVPERFRDPGQVYWWSWYRHHKRFLPQLLVDTLRPFMAIAQFGTERQRMHLIKAQRTGLEKSVSEETRRPYLAFWPAASHPCLQAADHFVWAVQRAETEGDRSYVDRLPRQIVEIHRL